MSDSEIAAAQSTVNDAYFTPTYIIDEIYKALNYLGFEGGNILEPSMGVGNFFGRLPKSIKKQLIVVRCRDRYHIRQNCKVSLSKCKY